MIAFKDVLQRMSSCLVVQELNDWAQNNFNKDLTVFVGIDVKNPPGLEDCPLVILRPASAEIGVEEAEHEYKVLVDFAVCSEEIQVVDNLKLYKGVFLIDELAQLVWKNLAAFSNQVVLSSSEYVVEPVEFFPMIVGGVEITMNVPNVIGGRITL